MSIQTLIEFGIDTKSAGKSITEFNQKTYKPQGLKAFINSMVNKQPNLEEYDTQILQIIAGYLIQDCILNQATHAVESCQPAIEKALILKNRMVERFVKYDTITKEDEPEPIEEIVEE